MTPTITRQRGKHGSEPTTNEAGTGEQTEPVVAAPKTRFIDRRAGTGQIGTGTSVPIEQAVVQDEVLDGAVTEADKSKRPRGLRGLLRRRRENIELAGQFNTYPHLLALKPREKYVFHSDYFQIDDSAACVMAFVHKNTAHDNFGAFWGINRIPDGLPAGVSVVVLEQIRKMDDRWVDNYIKQSEKLDRLDESEQAESGTASSRRRAVKASVDLQTAIAEIQDGASYLSVQNRLLVKAPDLETLDDALGRISRLYIDRFGTLTAVAYAGEQRQELSGLLAKNAKKRGKGFHFSSVELAGSYSLVTNGLNDAGGEYVGYMVGDVNNSAVLLDADDYDHHVVIADGGLNEYLGMARVCDMWGSKLSQSCLLNNGSVVHLVLNGADLNRLGPRLEGITTWVDMNSGDVNPFEMFGDQDDELGIFAAQMQKLTLLFEQLYDTGDGGTASIIRNSLEATATQFYVDQGMWHLNAKENRDRLRVVGVPHDQVPRLQMFTAYLDSAHEALLNSAKTDPDTLRAFNVLKGVAKNLLDNNGDLFNNFTADAIDHVRDSRRVVYDFSRLQRRGNGVAMAQLVNIVGFSVGKLAKGDTVVIHGAEFIDRRVKDYITTQLDHLFHRGGRVVFLYADIDKMLDDAEFNKFDAADYLVFGQMREKSVDAFQTLMHQQIPVDLAKQITKRSSGLSYLRRGVSNVVFHLDLALGVNPAREQQRRALHEEAAAQAQAQTESVHELTTPIAAGTPDGAPGPTRPRTPEPAAGPGRPTAGVSRKSLRHSTGPGRTTTTQKKQQLMKGNS